MSELSPTALDCLEAVYLLEQRGEDTDVYEILAWLKPGLEDSQVPATLTALELVLEELTSAGLLGWFYYTASTVKGHALLDERRVRLVLLNAGRLAVEGPRQRLSALAC